MSEQKEPGNKTRFTDLADELRERAESEEAFSDYKALLDTLDEDDSEIATIPFPYGGSSDFGKWVADEKSRTSTWKATEDPF